MGNEFDSRSVVDRRSQSDVDCTADRRRNADYSAAFERAAELHRASVAACAFARELESHGVAIPEAGLEWWTRHKAADDAREAARIALLRHL
jgi:hypothetical protein